MRAAPLLLFALVVAFSVVLAGCASPAVDPGSVSGAGQVTVVTSPSDFSVLENGTTLNGSHLHDYWGGKNRLVLMDESQRGGVGLWFGDAMPVVVFKPQAEHVVPLGTSRVEVTISWVDETSDLYANPELWVGSAEDAEPKSYGPVASGDMVVIESTNARNDLPHQLLSAWVFELRMERPNEATPLRFQGQVALHVEVVRGLDIPLFPAHPDRWGGAAEVGLLMESSEWFFTGDTDRRWSCYGGECPRAFSPRDGVVVPFDAASVEVVLKQEGTGPAKLGLSYHPANDRAWTRLMPSEESGNTRVYRIPVERGMADGPYALQSLWEFLPFSESPQSDGAYRGAFELTARALKSA